MGVWAQQVRPRLLDAALGERVTGDIRRRVCAGLTGDVLEIGFGSGLNLPHLPPEVRSVTAVDPSQVAHRLSAGRQATSSVPVHAAGLDAQELALPDDRFDAALSTWTLCGVPDPLAALREVRRVLRPGAVLHFVEHGLAPDERVVRWQRRGNGLNQRLFGCRLDRDVPALLAASGMVVTALETYYAPESPKPAGWFYEGRATA
jgi:SAM-dependent methyltransferase